MPTEAEGVGSPGARVSGGCELSGVDAGTPTLGPLEEQRGLLTVGQSLQAPTLLIETRASLSLKHKACPFRQAK